MSSAAGKGKKRKREAEPADDIERFDVDARFSTAIAYGPLVFITGQVGEGASAADAARTVSVSAAPPHAAWPSPACDASAGVISVCQNRERASRAEDNPVRSDFDSKSHSAVPSAAFAGGGDRFVTSKQQTIRKEIL